MKIRFVEFILLCSMLLVLIIPSNILSIGSWMEISPLLFIRSFVWLVGLSLLPGIYVLRLTAIGENLSKLEKIVVGINLSFVFVGLASVILYYFQGIHLLPWLFLIFLWGLAFFNLKKFKPSMKLDEFTPRFPKKLRISKWNLLLATGVISTIILSFYFQLGQRYLLPGDIWVSLKPAIQINSQRNVYEVFGNYPLMFGHILTTLSVCSGLPIVNTYAVLVPLTALNLLSFFIFIKNILKLNDNVASLSSLIYSFGAGFGLLIQFLGFDGTLGFMSLSRLAIDFSLPNYNAMLFSYKSLAFTQAFTSIVCLMIATKLEKTSNKIIAMVISSLLLLFSFYIHMLEAMIFIPLLFLVPYMYEKKWNKYLSFGVYLLIMLLVLSILDFFMDGFYLKLALNKIRMVMSSIGIEKILTYSLLSLGGFFLIFRSTKLVNSNLEKIDTDNLGKIKPILISLLLIIYICGLWFWKTSTPSGSFPWYRYVTRYGFIGIFALIGVAKSKWREKWFLTLSFWLLYIIFIGKMGDISDTWLERRIHSTYLVPIVVIFASIGFFEVWKKAKLSIRILISRTFFILNLKPVITILIVGISILSITSTIYGTVHYYGWNDPCISDDTARAFAWINENTPLDATILVPNIYNIYKGVDCISDREIYLKNNLPTNKNDLINTINDHNIKYALTVEDETSVLLVLLSQSTLIFESGDVKLYSFPNFQK